MMKKQIAALVLAVSVVGGVGAGVLANAMTAEAPAAANGATSSAPTQPSGTDAQATPEVTDPPSTDVPLVIAPGALGPVEVGMSKEEALATGYFLADVPALVDGCVALPLVFKKEYADALDVQTVGNGEISSIGIRGKQFTTKDGIGVGSTLADVKATIEDGTPVEAGYDQSGMYDYDSVTGRWIGYLFNASISQLTDSDTVSFVEVTKGGQPNLMRDGC